MAGRLLLAATQLLGLLAAAGGREGEGAVGAVLKDIVLVDVTQYLPEGYRYREAGAARQAEQAGRESSGNSVEISEKKIEQSAADIFNIIRSGKALSSLSQVSDTTTRRPTSSVATVTTTTTAATTTEGHERWAVVTGWSVPAPSTPPTTSSTTPAAWRAREERRLAEAERRREAARRREEVEGAPRCPAGAAAPCRLAGSLLLELHGWREELRQAWREETEAAVRRALQLGYYSSSFRSVAVRRILPDPEGVNVTFLLELQPGARDLILAQVALELETRLGAAGAPRPPLPGSLALGPARPEEREPPATAGRVEEGGEVIMPPWGWLVVVAGSLSTALIALFGCLVGAQRLRHSMIVARSLNSRTLNALKGGKNHLDLGASPAGLVDRRDMWTLQRSLQQDRSLDSRGSRDSLDRGRAPVLNRYEQLSLSSSSTDECRRLT